MSTHLLLRFDVPHMDEVLVGATDDVVIGHGDSTRQAQTEGRMVMG